MADSVKTHFNCGHPIAGNSVPNGEYVRCAECKRIAAMHYYHNTEVKKGKKKDRVSPYVNPPCLLSEIWR